MSVKPFGYFYRKTTFNASHLHKIGEFHQLRSLELKCCHIPADDSLESLFSELRGSLVEVSLDDVSLLTDDILTASLSQLDSLQSLAVKNIPRLEPYLEGTFLASIRNPEELLKLNLDDTYSTFDWNNVGQLLKRTSNLTELGLFKRHGDGGLTSALEQIPGLKNLKALRLEITNVSLDDSFISVLQKIGAPLRKLTVYFISVSLQRLESFMSMLIEHSVLSSSLECFHLGSSHAKISLYGSSVLQNLVMLPKIRRISLSVGVLQYAAILARDGEQDAFDLLPHVNFPEFDIVTEDISYACELARMKQIHLGFGWGSEYEDDKHILEQVMSLSENLPRLKIIARIKTSHGRDKNQFKKLFSVLSGLILNPETAFGDKEIMILAEEARNLVYFNVMQDGELPPDFVKNVDPVRKILEKNEKLKFVVLPQNVQDELRESIPRLASLKSFDDSWPIVEL